MSANPTPSSADIPWGAVPLAVPFAPYAPNEFAVSWREKGESRGTNTTPAASPPTRVGRRQLEQIAQHLSQRDRHILRRIWEHRFLTSKQIEGFVFTGHASLASSSRITRRVLARLARDHLIVSLARRIGGTRAGSEATIWQLTPAAARLLHPDSGRSWRRYEPSARFLSHCLAVADTHLALRSHASPEHPISVQVEPLSWRTFTGQGGQQRLLRPDLWAAIGGRDAQGDYEDHWFIEVDMGTESLPTLLKKCRLYEDYYRSGSEQCRHGSFPRVLWLMLGTRDQQRAASLSQRLERSSMTHQLFTICTAPQLSAALDTTN